MPCCGSTARPASARSSRTRRRRSAIERAQAHGSCVVALGNAHHIGRIGAWAEQAAAAGLASIHFVNVVARNIVAPHGGADARFGTNPFCAGVPFAGRDPVILDFATSVIAQGKTRVAHNKGEQVAEGVLLDDGGRPSTDPRYAVVPPFGALLTFGGHKGSGLAMMCELLGGALAAGMTQRDDDAGRRRILNGMLSVLIDPARIADRAAFEAEALAFIDWVGARRGVTATTTCSSPANPSAACARSAAPPACRSTRRRGGRSSTRLRSSASTRRAWTPPPVPADAGLQRSRPSRSASAVSRIRWPEIEKRGGIGGSASSGNQRASSISPACGTMSPPVQRAV